MSEELLPCPFCGETPDFPTGNGTQYEIECDCGMAMSRVQISDLMTIEERITDYIVKPLVNPRYRYSYGEEYILRAKAEATKMWNTRAPKETIMKETAKASFLASILKPGEHYAGIILGKNGEPDHHLILLPGEAESVNWAQAKEFAAKAGGELPTRREQSLLFANLKEQFQPRWYWSGDQHASYSAYAWSQGFSGGNQHDGHKGDRYRARAVRRLAI